MAWPLTSVAQQPGRVRRIGVLMSNAESDPGAQLRLAAFRQELQKLGWVDGGNIQLEYRWAAAAANGTQRYAAELAALPLDAIVCTGATAVAALRQATTTIPVVFVEASDPVATGAVASMANPGSNITGFIQYEFAIGGKWLELLTEISPAVRRVAVMDSPTNPAFSSYLKAIESAAPALGIEIVPARLRDGPEYERAIAEFSQRPNGGLIVMPSGFAAIHRELTRSLAARHRLPAIYPFRFHAAEGGLVSYGIDLVDVWRRAASYVDRIFRGEKPGSLPVQAPTKFELVINLKTAASLSLVVSPTLLARADAVIE